MAVGDVNVLLRLEKQDRRADRASQKLIKKLAKTRKNRAAPHIELVTPFNMSMNNFSTQPRLVTHRNTNCVQRRASRARGSDEKRAFFVAEALLGKDDDGVVVVVPRTQYGTLDFLAATISKQENPEYSVSSLSVVILQSDTPLTLGPNTGRFVCVRKLCLGKDQIVFYASCIDTATSTPPRTIGVDAKIYGKLQSTVARLAGWKLSRHAI
jgi:hypothetical protein